MLKNKLCLFVVVFLVLGLISFGVLGCEPEEAVEPEEPEEPEEPVEPEEPEEPEVKGECEILYVEWECTKASTYVVKAVLEEMGYEVTTTSVAASLMYSGLAAGDGDFMTTAWLPATHGHYVEEYGDEIDRVAVSMEGAMLCWVVPAYCEIDSIEEVNDYLDVINGEIIGIDPGAGLMHLSEDAIEEYGLDVELIEGSDATMTAALRDAIEREECIVATGWAPHWKFAAFDLKVLEDPKKVLGEEEEVVTFARMGLEEDMPEVYQLLQNFAWDSEQIGEVMEMNMEDPQPEENARIWVQENWDVVEQWIP